MVSNGTKIENSRFAVLLSLERASFKAMNGLGSVERRELGALLDTCESVVVGIWHFLCWETCTGLMVSSFDGEVW